MIDPSDVEVAGPMVTIEVTSDGPTPHNLTVRDADGTVGHGHGGPLRRRLGDHQRDLEPGTYTIFCSLAGHESLGMSGTLTVTGG